VVTSQPGFNIINGGKPQRDYTIPLFANSGLVMPVLNLTIPARRHPCPWQGASRGLTCVAGDPHPDVDPPAGPRRAKPGRIMFRSRETENRGPYQGKPDHSK